MTTEYKLSFSAEDINRRLEKVDSLVQTINNQVPDDNGNIDGLATRDYVDTSVTNTLQAVYPVGAIYLSVNNTSPASLFCGIWERIEDVFLLGAGTTYSAGSTGGEAKHTLAKNEVPPVTGEIVTHGVYSGTPIAAAVGCFSAKNTVSSKYLGGSASGADSISSIKFDNGGRGLAHNNMPPYLAVYMWKRIE